VIGKCQAFAACGPSPLRAYNSALSYPAPLAPQRSIFSARDAMPRLGDRQPQTIHYLPRPRCARLILATSLPRSPPLPSYRLLVSAAQSWWQSGALVKKTTHAVAPLTAAQTMHPPPLADQQQSPLSPTIYSSSAWSTVLELLQGALLACRLRVRVPSTQPLSSLSPSTGIGQTAETSRLRACWQSRGSAGSAAKEAGTCTRASSAPWMQSRADPEAAAPVRGYCRICDMRCACKCICEL
jgi:hypothetical protein